MWAYGLKNLFAKPTTFRQLIRFTEIGEEIVKAFATSNVSGSVVMP